MATANMEMTWLDRFPFHQIKNGPEDCNRHTLGKVGMLLPIGFFFSTMNLSRDHIDLVKNL
jgi:hypothetical protein